MAKLERKNFKVFAENAPLEEMGQFGSAVATTKKNTKDIEEIQELEAWQQGWGGAVISNKNYPPMEEMNGALNVMSYQTAYTLQEGIPEWNKDTVYYIGSIVKTLVDNKVVLYQSLKNENINNALDNSEYWEELKLGGGSGFQMFDIVPKDHILTFKESKGYAELGSYVYKTGVSGSRYGYPDFYNECVKQYQKGSNTWTQELLTQNGTMGGKKYAARCSTQASGSYYAYYAFDGDTSTRWSPSSRAVPQTLDYYTPIPIIPESVYLDFYSTDEAYSAGTIQGSNDDSVWYDLVSFSNNTSQTINLDIISTIAYKYFRFNATGSPTANSIAYGKVAEFKITGKSIYYKNPNGHIFYDISQKDLVDSIYDKNGIAWFYGVDTVNERIYIPRNDYFFQSGSSTDVGKFIGAGLPVIPNHTHAPVYINTSRADLGENASTPLANNSEYNGVKTMTDSSTGGVNNRSEDPIYGNSDTVQPPAVKQIYYMVVGNTETQSATTDVVDITTSENDTLPMFYNFYSPEDMTTTGAYVNASLGSYLSGNIWTSAYNELVNKIGQSFCSGTVKAYGDDTITDYDCVVNQDDMTFRLPLLDGSEDLPGDTAISTTFAEPQAGTYTYIAPQNGLFVWHFVPSATNPCTTVRSFVNGILVSVYQSNGYAQSVQAFAQKGDTITVQVTGNTLADAGTQRFIPAKGNGSLYFKLGNALQNKDIIDVAGVMSTLNTKTDMAQAANASMPSSRYVDLTLPAANTNMTAIADGYYTIGKSSNGSGQYVQLVNNTTGQLGNADHNGTSNRLLVCSVNCKKGDLVNINYNAGGVTDWFRFIYAQGAPST